MAGFWDSGCSRHIVHGTLSIEYKSFHWEPKPQWLDILCCTAHPFVGEMMHGGRNDGCRCVCVTQIGLFIRYKSNINIALTTTRLPRCQFSAVPFCVSMRESSEGGRAHPTFTSDQSSLLRWSLLDISNKTRIQIKWAEIWCNYLNATLRHKTKEEFFIAASSEWDENWN